MHVEQTVLHFQHGKKTYVVEIVAGGVRIEHSTFNAWTYADQRQAKRFSDRTAASACAELSLPLEIKHEYAPGVSKEPDVLDPEAESPAG